jgi:hypothetical protein
MLLMFSIYEYSTVSKYFQFMKKGCTLGTPTICDRLFLQKPHTVFVELSVINLLISFLSFEIISFSTNDTSEWKFKHGHFVHFI